MGSTWQSTLENKAVDAYLNYLTTGELPPSPNIDAKLEVMDARIAAETRMFKKVQLVQERREMAQPTITADDLIDDFVKHAPGFSERTGITYVTWREMGVPAGVLSRAGIGPNKNKMAPDDPNRKRPYHPRKTWTPEEKAEYVAFYEAHGEEATAEKYAMPGNVKTRYYGFKSDTRRAAGLPPSSKRGRPKKSASQAG
jgi:hypothetical protein